MRVLGIEVDEHLISQWRGWLMPERQPFLIPKLSAEALELGAEEQAENDDLNFETLDAFEMYGRDADEVIVWLDSAHARRLPTKIRAAQPTTHRWPTHDLEHDHERVRRYVESGRRPSRHLEVAESTWDAATHSLPGARAIAGTFPRHSGPNCFGAVMGAAGVVGAAGEWMQLEPFDTWLAAATKRGGDDDTPGTVLVWRLPDGSPTHAAITLGDGWLLHKPSQGWMSPTKVLSVRDGKYSARHPGQHIHRYRLS